MHAAERLLFRKSAETFLTVILRKFILSKYTRYTCYRSQRNKATNHLKFETNLSFWLVY